MRRRFLATTWTAAGLLTASIVACSAEPEIQSEPTPPPSLRATVSIEPAQLEIGEVATLELRVVTPPDHRVLPFEAPDVPGIWLLESRALETEKQEARWIHRTQLRLRPQDLGPVAWPEASLAVENAEGERVEIAAPGRDLEVVSMYEGLPDRVTPYGYQLPESGSEAPPVSGWLWGGGGVLLGWALAAALGWARPRRAPPASDEPEPAEPAPELYAWVEQELEGAAGAIDGDANSRRQAANRAARALRLFVARRFDTETTAKTTPELMSLRPPLRVQSRWPYFVRILESLDDLRFRPDLRGSHASRDETLRAAIGEARRFVESTANRGGHRTP